MHGGLCIPSLLTCVPALLSAGCLFYCPLPVCHPAHLVGERSHPGRCSGWHWILHWETVQHHQVDGGRGERWCQVRKHDTFLWLYGLGIYRTIYFLIQPNASSVPAQSSVLKAGFWLSSYPSSMRASSPVLATLSLLPPCHAGWQQILSHCLWAILQRQSFTPAKPAEMALGVGSSIAIARCPLALVVRISRRNSGCALPSKSPQEIGWVGKGALRKGSLDDVLL